MNRSFAHIMVAVPTRGQVAWQTVQQLEAIRDASKGLPPIAWQPGTLSVALTRNIIVRRFLASPCEVLVMVDDDVAPPPHMLDALLPAPQRLLPDGYGMVGLPDPQFVAQTGHLILTAWRQGPLGLANVQEFRQGWNDCDVLATGCCAIPRATLEQLGPDPFRMPNSPDAPALSDDFIFCEDVRAAGLRIGCWMDGAFADHVRPANLGHIMEAAGFGRTEEAASPIWTPGRG